MKARVFKPIFVFFLVFTLILSFTPGIQNLYAMDDLGTEDEVISEKNDNQALAVNAAIQKEEAIEIAKEQLNFSEDFQLTSVSFNSNWGYPDRSVWYLYWNLGQENNTQASINVTIDSEKGTILSVYYYLYNKEVVSSFPAKVSVYEAADIADKFIQEFFPAIVSKIQVDKNYLEEYQAPLNQPIYYYIPYRHLINNLPFSEQSVSVSVNGDGQISSFNYYYLDENIQFEPVENYISLDQAYLSFSEQLAVNLNFVFPYRQTSAKLTPYLAYTAFNQSQPLDAQTGEPYYYQGQVKINTANEPLVAEPLAEPPLVGEVELSQDQVLEIAKKYQAYFQINLPEISSINYDSNYYSTKRGVWNISWYNDGRSEKYYYYNMTIDASTGELINYYSSDNDSSSENADQSKLSYETAKELAISTVKELAPSRAHQVTLNEDVVIKNTENLQYVYFNFKRLVHGIPVDNESIRVSVNLTTGKIYDFSVTWGLSEFPEVLPSTIEPDAAKQLILDKLELELVYFAPYVEKGTPREAVLVYQPIINYNNNPTFLDATLGEWRSRNDGSLLSDLNPTDLQGHWAEKELQLMVDYRAITVEDGKISPESKITRGELIKMFILASYGGNYYPYFDGQTASFKDVSQESPYYSYIEEAVRSNIITVPESKEFNPDEQVTREELAQLIVKALGYDKLAQTEGLFAFNFNDQESSQYPGHIAIVSSLKIMNGNGESFFPTQKVTKAVAAVSFYRFLEARNKLQENTQPYPIYYK